MEERSGLPGSFLGKLAWVFVFIGGIALMVWYLVTQVFPFMDKPFSYMHEPQPPVHYFVGLDQLAFLVAKAWALPITQLIGAVFGIVVMAAGVLVFLWYLFRKEPQEPPSE